MQKRLILSLASLAFAATGSALAQSGRREEALLAYDALLADSPGNSDLLLGRGQLHAWMKHWPEAEADLRAAADASPTYADVWMALGNMYLWSDRPHLAAEAYGKWIELKPNDVDARIARGRAWRAAGDTAAARADFEAASAPALVQYSLTARVPLGSDLFAYSYADLLTTVQGGAGFSPWLLCGLMLGLACLWQLLAWRRRWPSEASRPS